MRSTILISLLALMLVACGPSLEEIAAMTAAVATDTPVPTAIATVVPSTTPEPSLTPEPTPVLIRVNNDRYSITIDGDPLEAIDETSLVVDIEEFTNYMDWVIGNVGETIVVEGMSINLRTLELVIRHTRQEVVDARNLSVADTEYLRYAWGGGYMYIVYFDPEAERHMIMNYPYRGIDDIGRVQGTLTLPILWMAYGHPDWQFRTVNERDQFFEFIGTIYDDEAFRVVR